MDEEKLISYFEYLRWIRANGIKNQIGAKRWLEDKFHLSPEEASKIIAEWNRQHAFID